MSLDLSRWLAEFPVREQCLFLDHAAVCPLPRPVAAAMRKRIDEQELEGHLKEPEWDHFTLTCRHLGSQLVGCSPDDVTIVTSTSQGLSLIAEGLDWEKGDRVLVGEEEFAANVAPWLHLETRGVKVDRFPQPDGRISPDEIGQFVDSSTRVLAVSWVAFHTGWIAPLAQLARICKDNGTLLIVDGIQGLGVLPMNMNTLGIDAVVADAHKWLLGPEGVGLMATSPRLREQLRPVLAGWRNVQLEPGDYFLQEADFHSDGRRFEPGAVNGVGIAGLAAALDLLNAVGLIEVHSRIETMNRLITRILLAHGWDVYSPGSGHPAAGIVAARHPGIAPKEAQRRLLERRIIVSARQGYVRFSPHFYITRGELEAFDRILEKVGL